MKLIMKSTSELIKERNIEKNGKVQKFIDNECNKNMAKYTPLKTGLLRSSVSGIGTGKLKQSTPYARKQYYDTNLNHPDSRRGAKWFEVMKRNHKRDILRGAKLLSGGK